jgi:aryl-alcohol dehydrogenase-like predicted oxidoreductase
VARLCWAQLLVTWVPFNRWRHTLGFQGAGREPGSARAIEERRLAADVEWAARRLPFGVKCLPRAMALSWMLRRRKLGHAVVIAVRPRQLRRSPDALHAWLEVDGAKIIGDLPGPWIETLRLGA